MRRILMLALALTLGGCDDNPTIITHTDKLGHMSLDDLWTMQDGQGIPVEIHGRPFSNVTDRELAEALRPPSGSAQGVRFYARPAGAWAGGHGYRMVMHFNPNGPPNSYHDCRMTAEQRTRQPAEQGFSVNVSFCRGEESHAHGFLQAPRSPAGDLEEYARVVRVLFMEIFREEMDR